jgi:hypothetical protein
MGNQASKVLATNNKKKTAASIDSGKKGRRTSSSVISHGNYDWLDQDLHPTAPNENVRLNAAVSAAVALQQQKQQKQQQPLLSSSAPAPPPSPTIPLFNNTRRKSISEFFARRKQSLVHLHPAIVEEDMKEYDRLQRQVNINLHPWQKKFF